ncbi:unnamed protein product [Dibothriocephalus latus]|uniref:Nicotinamide phosphoribosyltransferase n=1 Tax=Dibothriocephalus latus TaxID=60516 RepID=A0A3P7LYL7_DIBLA|nr:unnamed protein product [Dibothriocephalus latus]
MNILGEKFGYELNSKGYKVLPPYLRLIQGDGVNLESLGKILESVKKAGWSTVNVSFGSGGALLQRLNRDTQKCAFKCSHTVVNGKQVYALSPHHHIKGLISFILRLSQFSSNVNVCKHPITDPQKTSKKGRLCLLRSSSENGYITMEEGLGDLEKDLLIPVFENGHLLREYTFDEIRERAELPEVKRLRDVNFKNSTNSS